jgi:cell division protein FtsQ
VLAVPLALWAGAAGWRAFRATDRLRIRDIRYAGLVHATADELSALSPVRPGDHLLLSDVEAMGRALSRHPWVRRVEIERAWPPALAVRVTERTAVALLDLGGLYLVDDEGNVFKRAAAGDGLDLPLVTGIARGDFVQRRAAVEPLLGHALALARAWREDGREKVARLSEIHADADGFTLYVGDEGTEVRLGSGDLPAKLSRLEQVLSTLGAEGKKAEVLHLDNRLHPSWVTVRLARAASAQSREGRGP